jgi:hypothetical protein
MRFYTLLNFQHVVAYIFPTLIFITVFGVGLAFSHFYSRDSETRKKTIYHRYPDGIEDREAPFPLVMTLIIVGTALWAFFYIWETGTLGVKI